MRRDWISMYYSAEIPSARNRALRGDIEGLAASIDAIGLLQPIGITMEKRLVYGERRVRAYQHNGIGQRSQRASSTSAALPKASMTRTSSERNSRHQNGSQSWRPSGASRKADRQLTSKILLVCPMRLRPPALVIKRLRARHPPWFTPAHRNSSTQWTRAKLA